MTEPTYETILLDVDAAGVATLTINRPEVRNALNLTMVEELRAALRTLAGREELRALVITGAGDRAFLGGADIGELRDRGRADALARINSALFREVEQFPQPTIAAIRGFCLGGGCELALACDLRVAGQGAKLGQPEVGLGIIPGAGATYRLPRLVGLGRARELIFTGRIVGADEALALGLVERVVPDAEVLDAARALAGEIAVNSGLAVRLAKQALNLSAGLATDAAMAFESTAQAVLFEDEEKRRRMTAFLERKAARKQKPAVVRVEGLVGEPFEVSFADLSSLSRQVPDVGQVVSGRRGRGVRLGELLARARPEGGADHVQVTSQDGRFKSSLPRERMEQAVIVYALEGRPLPEDQGGPFRLLIPEAPDPCANVKQVGRVEVLASPGENACGHTDHEEARAPKGR